MIGAIREIDQVLELVKQCTDHEPQLVFDSAEQVAKATTWRQTVVASSYIVMAYIVASWLFADGSFKSLLTLTAFFEISSWPM